MQPKTISQLIRKRRSIFPKTYTNQPIAKEIIEEVLENANWAPTHKMTEPWRFKVLVDDALIHLREIGKSIGIIKTRLQKNFQLKN